MTENKHGFLRAACECGWRGAQGPITADGEDQARADWEHNHLEQLITEAARWLAWADRIASLAKVAVAHVDAGRYAAADTLTRLAALVSDGRRMAAELAEEARRNAGAM